MAHARGHHGIYRLRALADLPPNARRYVERLAELVGAPVVLLSVGPQRD